MMTYKEIKPLNKLLLRYIDNYALISGEKLISKDILPQLVTSLVLDFNKNTLFDDHRCTTMLIGYHEKPYRISTISPFNDKIVIKFSPYGLTAFSHIPVYKTNNQFINAEDLFGHEIMELHRSLQSIPTLDQRLLKIENFLLEKLVEPSFSDKMIFELANTIKQQDELSSFGLFKNSLNLSSRQIERKFKDLIGVNIGTYVKIMRFNKAKQMIEEKTLPRYTDIANEAGYYDQSHFISNFKMFTGVSPKRFVSAYTSCKT